MKHRHAELIKAWADGAKIQAQNIMDIWVDLDCPDWRGNLGEYRIKPEPKPDVVLWANVMKYVDGLHYANITSAFNDPPTSVNPANLQLTFDGETGELKSAKVSS